MVEAAEEVAAEQNQSLNDAEGEEEKKTLDDEEGLEDGEEEEGEADDSDKEGDFINNHDLIGVRGIIEAQKNEIEKKKVRKFERRICCNVLANLLNFLSIVGTTHTKWTLLQAAPWTHGTYRSFHQITLGW